MSFLENVLNREIKLSDQEIELANKILKEEREDKIREIEYYHRLYSGTLKNLYNLKDYMNWLEKEVPNFKNNKEIKEIEDYLSEKIPKYEERVKETEYKLWGCNNTPILEINQKLLKGDTKFPKRVRKAIDDYKKRKSN